MLAALVTAAVLVAYFFGYRNAKTALDSQVRRDAAAMARHASMRGVLPSKHWPPGSDNPDTFWGLHAAGELRQERDEAV